MKIPLYIAMIGLCLSFNISSQTTKEGWETIESPLEEEFEIVSEEEWEEIKSPPEEEFEEISDLSEEEQQELEDQIKQEAESGVITWLKAILPTAIHQYIDRLGQEIGDRKKITYIEGGNLLRKAAQEGDSLTVNKLIEAGIDPNDSFNTADLVGLTPLHLATGAGHEDVVNALLKAGANYNAFFSDATVGGMSVLHLATIQNLPKTVDKLLQYANPNFEMEDKTSGKKLSAIDLAKRYGHVAIAQRLSEHPALSQDQKLSQDFTLDEMDTRWQFFDRDTPEVVTWKINMIELAYQKAFDHINTIIGDRSLTSLSQEELGNIKSVLSSLLNQIKEKTTELHTTIANGNLSPSELLSAWNQEWEANRLGPPEGYYPMLGYATWQDGVNASFEEVKNRLEEKLASDMVSEEEKQQLRQLTYYFFSKSKKKQLDLLLQARNAPSIEERDNILRQASLGEQANELIDRFSEINLNNALMELKMLEDSINREMRTRE